MAACHVVSRVAALVLVLTTAASASTKDMDMHFYMHDIVGTASDTTVLVAGPKNNVDTIEQFGSVMIIDDPLTKDPSINSTLIGRAQGTYMTDSMSVVSLLLTFTAAFNNEDYKGTICFHGQDPVFDEVREIAVIGGTGDFRFVRGYATMTTESLEGLAAVLSVKVHMKQDVE